MTVRDNRVRGIRQNVPAGHLIGRGRGDGKAQLLSPSEIRQIINPGYVKSVAGTPALTTNHIFVGNASNVATDVAMSGDATIVAAGTITLATVNSNVGSFTNANITVNAKGLITAAANGSGSSGDISPFSDGGITKPAAADFTIADDTTGGHGTGTKADLAHRGVELTNTRGANATTQSLFYEAAVSNTLVSMIAYIEPNFHDVNATSGYFYGLAVRDNAGKIDSFGLAFSAAVGNCVWVHPTFTNISTAPTINALSGGHMASGRPIWLKLAKVSTNFVFSVSFNGETYADITTVSATGFIGSTINDVGIILYNALGAGSTIINLDVFSFAKS